MPIGAVRQRNTLSIAIWVYGESGVVMAQVQVRMSASEVRELLSLRGHELAQVLSDPERLLRYRAAEKIRNSAGKVSGRHYSAHVPRVKALEKNGELTKVVELLLRLLDAVEEETLLSGADAFIPPWYYKRLAMAYKKLRQPEDEISALQRYVDMQRRIGSDPGGEISERLSKAIAKQQA